MWKAQRHYTHLFLEIMANINFKTAVKWMRIIQAYRRINFTLRMYARSSKRRRRALATVLVAAVASSKMINYFYSLNCVNWYFTRNNAINYRNFWRILKNVQMVVDYAERLIGSQRYLFRRKNVSSKLHRAMEQIIKYNWNKRYSKYVT